ENTFNFLENVLDEVMQLFPSTYIHIGGDEAPKDNWKRCAHCQKLIRKEGLKDEHELQSYFVQRIEKYLNSKGRKIIGWDEILEGGLAPNATVMSWRGEEGGIEAASDNHDVIMTPGGWMYFDHTQTKQEDSVTIGGFTPLEKVYKYQPVPAKLDASKAGHVLGAQANVWTEYMAYPSKVEYMIFPRMSALSEVLWTPESRKNWNRFKNSLPFIYQRYQLWGANYFKNSEQVMKEQ
ncbi:MAG: family 20 glycosylhydrolase, partial [Chitinophagaceae bacterium]|nr:family 20 glycosylhydrolase [Chitinophagaceae bacterium]